MSKNRASMFADLFDALEECEQYFDTRADADCDQDGFIPNKEMQILSKVRDAVKALEAIQEGI